MKKIVSLLLVLSMLLCVLPAASAAENSGYLLYDDFSDSTAVRDNVNSDASNENTVSKVMDGSFVFSCEAGNIPGEERYRYTFSDHEGVIEIETQFTITGADVNFVPCMTLRYSRGGGTALDVWFLNQENANKKVLGITEDGTYTLKIVANNNAKTYTMTLNGNDAGSGTLGGLVNAIDIGVRQNGSAAVSSAASVAYDYVKVTPAYSGEFKGAGLTLNTGLSLYYTVKDVDTENLAADKYHVTFTKDGIESDPVTVVTEKNGSPAFVYSGLTAVEMGKTVTAKLYYGKTLLDTASYSVQQYCQRDLEGASASGNLRQLLVDLLKYGEACETQFNEPSITYDPADILKALGGTAVTSIDDDMAWGSGDTQDTSKPVQFKAAGLSPRDSIAIYFDVVPATAENLVLKVDGEEVSEWKKVTVNGTERIRFYYTNLNPTNMTETVTAQVYQNDEPVSDSLTYSIQSYCYWAVNESGDAKLAALAQAMMTYGASTSAYVADTDGSPAHHLLVNTFGGGTTFDDWINLNSQTQIVKDGKLVFETAAGATTVQNRIEHVFGDNTGIVSIEMTFQITNPGADISPFVALKYTMASGGTGTAYEVHFTESTSSLAATTSKLNLGINDTLEHTLKIIADNDNKTCNVYLDGKLKQWNFNMGNPVNRIDIGFRAAGKGAVTEYAAVAYDNLVITTTEADNVIFYDNFDDGDITNNPAWSNNSGGKPDCSSGSAVFSASSAVTANNRLRHIFADSPDDRIISIEMDVTISGAEQAFYPFVTLRDGGAGTSFEICLLGKTKEDYTYPALNLTEGKHSLKLVVNEFTDKIDVYLDSDLVGSYNLNTKDVGITDTIDIGLREINAEGLDGFIAYDNLVIRKIG